MDNLSFEPVKGFVDNYFWLLHRGGRAVVVDPGDAAPVRRTLAEHRLELAAILVTHHHPDHTGGIAGLLADKRVPVLGPRAESRAIPWLTQTLAEGDPVALPELGLQLEVWELPGHTLGHIAFLCRAPGAEFVLCGDTLFMAGCGRLFEGSPGQMHRSLSRLASLADPTAVYCTHEYTLANLRFAAAVEPGNADIARETERIQALRDRGLPSLPSSIGLERKINPFLRCSRPAVRDAAVRHLGRPLPSEPEVFAALRRWKDGFG